MQLHQFALKVGEAASKLRSVETTMGDVPEEFLDPILGTIMSDPVIPNSQVTLDKTFNVRYLLRYVFHYDIYIDNILIVFHSM